MTNFILLLLLSFSIHHASAAIAAVRGGSSATDTIDAMHSPEEAVAAPLVLDPNDNESLIAKQFSDDPYQGENKLELILSGKFMLSDVRMGRNGEATQGHFCEFDFERQQNDPSLVPRFMDLYGETLHCQEHHVTMDLHEVAEACRKLDASPTASIHSIQPNAFIFHQPKSGSSLITNMIAASLPGARVVSEPAALSEIVACQKCKHENKLQALQDAMYLLGRTATPTTNDKQQEHLFVKLSSASTIGLSVVRDSFPDTKWIFVYRDADTILQKLMNSPTERRMCAHKKRRNPGAAMTDFLKSQEKSVATLETDEQVCAAFLATNMATVQRELALHDTSGRLVEYSDLMTRVGIQELFEYLEVRAPNWNRMEEQRKKRANNGRGQEWSGEGELTITRNVKSATAEFELSSY